MNFTNTLHIKNENENKNENIPEMTNVMNIQDLLTYSAALLGALAFLWSAFRLYKTKKPQRIDIDIYVIFFISQILWVISAVIDKDYLLLIFYSINIIIYFYIFFYHSKNNI